MLLPTSPDKFSAEMGNLWYVPILLPEWAAKRWICTNSLKHIKKNVSAAVLFNIMEHCSGLETDGHCLETFCFQPLRDGEVLAESVLKEVFGQGFEQLSGELLVANANNKYVLADFFDNQDDFQSIESSIYVKEKGKLRAIISEEYFGNFLNGYPILIHFKHRETLERQDDTSDSQVQVERVVAEESEKHIYMLKSHLAQLPVLQKDGCYYVTVSN